MKAKKENAKKWIKENVQKPIPEIIKKLNIKLVGHYRYYGISENSSRLNEFRRYLIRTLFKQLRRRGQKRKINWEKFNKILKYNPVALPKIYVSLYK